MSEIVRTHFSATQSENDTPAMLDEIYAHYVATYPKHQITGIYRNIAANLSEQVPDGKPWQWRYVQSVHRGTVAPSDRFSGAIGSLWRFVHGIPDPIPAPPCPTCGGACTYDCGKQRPTALPGTGNRARANRPQSYEIFSGTAPADVIRKLGELGHHVAYVEGEIDY